MAIITDLLDLLLPRNCCGCKTVLAISEEHLCTKCLINLPRTGFYKEPDNPTAQTFWGRVNIINATSFLHFNKKGTVQHIMHQIKYKDNLELAIFMGTHAGHELKSTPFAEIDVIIPVPLHKSRFTKRGYNQSERIARGIAEVLDKPIDNQSIIRAKSSESQVTKKRYQRWENVEGIFKVVEPQNLANRHILLIDDILTTGATVEACAQEILKIEGSKVSIFTLAKAKQ
jgi:ComF family protein